jgi:hypothetical protein
MGIGNDKAKIHIELNKDPKTIEEAVVYFGARLLAWISYSGCFLTFGQKQNLQLLPEIWAIIPATYLYCSNFASVLPPQIYLSKRPEPSKSRSYSYNESFSSSEDSTEESDLESLATSQIVRPKQMKRNHTAIAKLSAYTDFPCHFAIGQLEVCMGTSGFSFHHFNTC